MGLVGGVLLLGYLIHRSGPWVLLEYLKRVGGWIFLLLLVAALRNSFRSVACRWAMGEERGRFSLPAMYGVLLVSEAIKFVAFAGLFFGESAKALLLRRRVSSARAVSSVVLDVLLYNLSATLFLFAGTGLLFWHLPASPEVRQAGFLGGMVVAAGILVATMAFARRWLTAGRILGAVARIRPPRRAPFSWLDEWARKHREKIAETDEQVFHFYRRHTALFYGILLFDMAAHFTSALEVFVAMRLLGLPLGYWDAVAVEGLTKLVSVGGAIVPASIGVYEGGNALILQALGLKMAAGPDWIGAGVALGIVRKLRSILWAGIGFAVLMASVGRRGLAAEKELEA